MARILSAGARARTTRPAPARRAGRRRPRSRGATARRRENRSPGCSMASRVPSSACATALKPGWVRTRLVVVAADLRPLARPARPPASPATVRTASTGRTSAPPGSVPSCADHGRAGAARAGRRRARPSPACRGTPRARAGRGSSAASSRASSQASRSGRQPAVRGCGLLAVARRVDVGAAGDHQPVEAGDHRRGRARPVDRGQQHRHPADGRTAAAYAAGSRSARCCHTPQAACSR